MRLWIVLLLLFGFTSGARAGRRYALVIGNEVYDRADPWHPARGAAGDASEVTQAARRLGFEVLQAEINLGHRSFVAAVERFTQQLTKDDMALVFYSGHGGAAYGVNYLIPADMPDPTRFRPEQWERRAIALGWLIDQVRARVGTSVFFFGNCLVAIPGLSGFARQPKAAQDWALRKLQTEESFIAYGTSLGQFALGARSDDLVTPFGKAVLEYLEQPLEIRELMRKVQARVYAYTQQFQKPTYEDWLSQELFLAGRPSLLRRSGFWRVMGGVAALAAGLGLSAYGAYALAIDGRCVAPPVPPQKECAELYQTRTTGGVLLGVGGALAVGGGLLVGLPARREPVQLTLSPFGLGAQALVRF